MNSQRKLYKIAIVAACPFPANWGTPGAIREMVETLMRRGHDVHVVTYSYGENLSVGGAHIWRSWHWRKVADLRSGPSWEKIVMDWFLLFELIRVIRREGIQIIHAHNYEAAVLGSMAKLITGKPLVFNAVGLLSDELPGYGLMPIVTRRVGHLVDWLTPRFADHTITVTERLRSMLIALGIKPDRVHAVAPSVDPAFFEGADPALLRARLNFGPDPVVIYTGICSPLQRLDYLLHAFSLVVRDEPRARLLMLTPLRLDPDLQQCQVLAASLGIDHRITWVQGHELEELRHYLALADITAFSRPNMPGQPIKLLNAMMAGKPTVCFAGAAEGVEHLREVFIAPDHDWRRLAEGILTLIRNPEQAREMGRMARQTVLENYNPDVLCDKVERVYAALAVA
jgi:1,2-diacylglycerol 3-alpha-glucosyltransferase